MILNLHGLYGSPHNTNYKLLLKEYNSNPQPTYMILGMDDEVLSPTYTEQFIQADKLWKIRGGHSLSGNDLFYAEFETGIKAFPYFLTTTIIGSVEPFHPDIIY